MLLLGTALAIFLALRVNSAYASGLSHHVLEPSHHVLKPSHRVLGRMAAQKGMGIVIGFESPESSEAMERSLVSACRGWVNSGGRCLEA
jgi:hypothetical protein